MPLCSVCRMENPLGRVFCLKCGAKLDAASLSHARVIADVRQPSRVWAVVLPVLLALVVTTALLALWPHTAVPGERGTLVGAQRAASALRAMHMTAGAVETGREFSEGDLNGYFEVRRRRAGGPVMGLEAGEGRVRWRGVRRFELPRFGRFQPALAVSFDAVFRAEGGAPVMTGGAIGHLPLPGPLAAPLSRLIAGRVLEAREGKFLRRIVRLTAADGRVTLVVGP
jgi:hypothetical protein